MLNYKKIIATFFFMIVLAIGVSMVIKPEIGIGTYDAVNKTLSNITGIKVGTVTTVVNAIIVLSQFIIMWNEFNPLQLFQIPLIGVFGVLLNFMLYNVLTFEMTNYIGKFLMFFIGNAIVAFGAAGIVNMEYIYTPLEGFISAVSKKAKGDFVRYRLYFDITCVTITLLLTVLFRQQLVIREGTIIAAIIFAPMMGVFIKLQKPLFRKLGILGEENKVSEQIFEI